MNRTDPSTSRRSLRGLVALVGGLALGATAILALAVPAGAQLTAAGGDRGHGCEYDKGRGHHDKGKGPKPTKSACPTKTPSKSPSSPPVSESPSASPSETVSPSPTVPPESPTASPSPVPGAGGGAGELPVTGASVGTAIGVAAGLLAIGAALYIAFRRRRIRFTT